MVRVHPIITRGGDSVNTVPADVALETYVRAANVEAIEKVNARVDRAVLGAATAVGAGVEVINLAGYLPLRPCPPLIDLVERNARDLLGEANVGYEGHGGATTDVGDISHLMPAVNIWCGGASGGFHTPEFVVEDYGAAVIDPAKVIVASIIDLLAAAAAGSRLVGGAFEGGMSKGEYLSYLRSMTSPRRLAEPVGTDWYPSVG